MPSAKVIQLRHVLAEKFPGLRLQLGESAAKSTQAIPKDLYSITSLFENQLVKGTLNELIAGDESIGSGTFLSAALSWASKNGKIVALIDGNDSLDVTSLEPSSFSQLMWIRCQDADKSLKATDLLIRDGNFSIIILDLKLNPEVQLRKIPATIWYRLQRLVEMTGSVCLVMTPRPMIIPAHKRITLSSYFSMSDMERDSAQLEAELKWDIAESYHARKIVQFQSA